MRHRNAFQKFSRTMEHRRAMFRNLATNLVLRDEIVTTVQKAKDLKRIADKLVTLGKRNTLHTRRQALSYLMPVNRHADHNAHKTSAVHRLFTEIAPRYADRNGGYTRVLRIGKRDGDKAELAVIQFVESEISESAKKPQKRARRVVKKSGAKESAVAEATE